MSRNDMSRRGFVSGAAVTALGTGMIATASAAADESALPANGLPVKYDVDILIIGGGQAGFSAGMQAKELGVERVLIIDKTSGEDIDFAGSSLRCGGSYLTPAEDTPEAREAFVDTLWNYAEGHTLRELFEPYGEMAFETKAWMEEKGVVYTEPKVNFPAYPQILSQSMTPKETFPLLREHYLGQGGEIAFNTKALHFNIDVQGVCGVVAKDPEGYFNIAAKKVILASGGYTSGKQFLEDHVDDGDEIVSRAPSCITGDGIYMVQEIGGCTVQSCGIKSVYLIPISPYNLETGRGGVATDFVVVNKEGKRYFDESIEHWRHGQVLLAQPDASCAYIADEHVWADNVESKFGSFEAMGVPTYECATIEEVAAVIGCDAEVLSATVEEFNAAVVDDHTEGLAINKKSGAYPLDQPPFHVVYPMVPGCSLCYGGIKVNNRAEVLQADGSRIDNLFAAGEVTGGFFYNGYFGGEQMTKAAIYGRLAAQNATAELQG